MRCEKSIVHLCRVHSAVQCTAYIYYRLCLLIVRIGSYRYDNYESQPVGQAKFHRANEVRIRGGVEEGVLQSD